MTAGGDPPPRRLWHRRQPGVAAPTGPRPNKPGRQRACKPLKSTSPVAPGAGATTRPDPAPQVGRTADRGAPPRASTVLTCCNARACIRCRRACRICRVWRSPAPCGPARPLTWRGRLKLGDAGVRAGGGGGYAELCTAPAGQCLPVPKGLSDIEAASLPETFFTVWSNVF